jgi:hypothetical protein
MTSDGTSLTLAVHRETDVQRSSWTSLEGRSELRIEGPSHPVRDSPGGDGKVPLAAGATSGLGGAPMVRVPADTAFVKNQQQVSRHGIRHGQNLSDERIEGDARELPVGVVKEPHGGHLEDGGGFLQFPLAKGAEVAGHAVQGRRLAVGEAEHGSLSASAGECGEHGAKPKGLIVGVGHDGQHSTMPEHHLVLDPAAVLPTGTPRPVWQHDPVHGCMRSGDPVKLIDTSLSCTYGPVRWCGPPVHRFVCAQPASTVKMRAAPTPGGELSPCAT